MNTVTIQINNKLNNSTVNDMLLRKLILFVHHA